MPRTKSALKAERGAERRRIQNTRQQNNLDRVLRALRKAGTATEKEVSAAQQTIDKAAKNGLFHARRAARLKGQLMRLKAKPKK